MVPPPATPSCPSAGTPLPATSTLTPGLVYVLSLSYGKVKVSEKIKKNSKKIKKI
jgi:hypothetical protein